MISHAQPIPQDAVEEVHHLPTSPQSPHISPRQVWSKKFRIEPAKTDRDVIRVEVDGKHVEDYGVLCDTILRKEEVSVSVMLKPVGYDDD